MTIAFAVAMNHRSALSIVAPEATAEEAAAVVAALERFMRETAPRLGGRAGTGPRRDAWQQAALREGVARQPELYPGWP